MMISSAEVLRKSSVKNPKVSVIVSVYNVASVLHETISSILNQTYKNFELICVDDGSTDNSLDILIDFVASDDRITILSQRNRFAGVARNEGMLYARGEYLLFLDSDDTFDCHLIEETVAAAEAANADIVCYDAECFDVGNHCVLPTRYLALQFTRQLKVFNHETIPQHLLRIVTPAPWNRLFRRSFIEKAQLQFQPLRNTNDLYFTCMAMLLADRITYVDKKLVRHYANQSTGIQEKEAKEPLNFLIALQGVYDSLNNMGLFDQFKKNFFTRLTLDLAANLRTMSKMETQDYIFDHLKDFSCIQALLDADDSDIAASDDYKNFMRFYWSRQKASMTKSTTAQEHTICMQGNVSSPKVSVLIPVYNVEPFLRECLDSVLNQTMQDFEIVAVNDGSKDGSLDILMAYAQRDQRITVITQENQGLSAARNAAVSHAQGEYIYFLDSDDALDPEMLALTYDKASREKLDVLLFDCTVMPGAELVLGQEELAKKIKYYSRSMEYSDVYTGPDMFCELRAHSDYLDSACLQLINRSYFQSIGISFKYGMLHEDQVFTFKLLLQAERVSHLHKPLFLRRYRAGSITTVAHTFAHAYAYFYNYISIAQFLENRTFNYHTWQRINEMTNAILNVCKYRYISLSQPEKNKMFLLPLTEQYMITNMIAVSCATEAKLKQTNDSLKKAWESAKKYSAHYSDANDNLKKALADSNHYQLLLNDTNDTLESARSNAKYYAARLEEANDQMTALKRSNSDMRGQLKLIQNSRSFRFCNAVLKYPRLVRRGLQYIKAHGLAAAFQRFFEKVAQKFKKKPSSSVH